MNAQDNEGHLIQDVIERRHQIGFADLLASHPDLPLRDAVHRVDVIQALHPVLIALVHAVDTQIPRTALGRGRFAYPDGDLMRARLAPALAAAHVAFLLTKVVQMRHRDRL